MCAKPSGSDGSKPLSEAIAKAVLAARQFEGATAPNPPVGAVGLDAEGGILAVAAHEKAGTPHAEPRVIDLCRKSGTLDRLHTLVVTLEPCNHTGRTPPCTEAILSTSIRRVVIGTGDPNPKVQGGGAARLRDAGLEVIEADDESSRDLIAPFSHFIRTGRPYVTIKTAHRLDGSLKTSMLPPEGQKTFTSPSSLKLAHELRRRADAILTGSGTVLADSPLFTVRHVPDHPGKKRFLVVLDRRNRVSEAWFREREEGGFQVARMTDLAQAIEFLKEKGAMEVLIEAGPTLSEAVLKEGIWNEHVVITQQSDGTDRVEIRRR